MPELIWTAIAVVLVVVVLAVVFWRRLGQTDIKLPGARIRMKSSDKSIARADNVNAEGTIAVRNETDGDAVLRRATAGGDIEVTSRPSVRDD